MNDLELVREPHTIYKVFYSGQNAYRVVDCILDDNKVRFTVWDHGRLIKRKEFPNGQENKNECFKQATIHLNKGW